MTLVDKSSQAIYRSNTAEGMLLEAAMLLQAIELHTEFNTSSPQQNRINIIINTDTKIASITANIPITFLALDGVNFHASEYLITPNNTPLGSQPII